MDYSQLTTGVLGTILFCFLMLVAVMWALFPLIVYLQLKNIIKLMDQSLIIQRYLSKRIK